MAACGWCLAFDASCCAGRFDWCEHGSRCDMTKVIRIEYGDIGRTWCYEHGREDWCANKRREKKGVDMSKVIEEAQELLDAEVVKVVAGTDDVGEVEAAKIRARGIVDAMAVFLNRDANELAGEAVARCQRRGA